jgi:hypothetical protein
MTIDPELLAIMTQTIVVENPIPAPNTEPGDVPPVLDGYGRHYVNESGQSGGTTQYGAPKTYKCRLEYQTKVLATIDGRDRVSSGRAYLAGFYPAISTECRVTIPNQTQESRKHPVVMYVENNFDETGLVGYNTTLHFE